MIFIFDSDIAKMVGVNGAVLFHNIAFWIMKNKANKQNFFDGEYWTYNSNQAFVELFPFMSADQIRTALRKLEDADLIKSGNYNDQAFDRTKWYTFGNLGKCIWEKSQMSIGKNPKPIPDVNTDINNIEIDRDKSLSTKSGKMDDFAVFWKAYPKKKSKGYAEKSWRRLNPPIDQVLEALEKQKKSAKWLEKDGQYIPYPSKWLNGKCWEDEVEQGYLHGHVHLDATNPDTYTEEEKDKERWNAIWK